MELCIPIEPRAEGGMYSFLELFRAHLDRCGVRHTRDPHDRYDVLFANAWVVPYELVREIKRRRPAVRVVQRTGAETHRAPAGAR